jgi:hypothetical protein
MDGLGVPTPHVVQVDDRLHAELVRDRKSSRRLAGARTTSDEQDALDHLPIVANGAGGRGDPTAPAETRREPVTERLGRAISLR